MSRLRVAVLEDEPEKLKHLIGLLRDTQLVDVVAYSCLKDEFIQRVDATRPEALVLDIDLNGEPDGGIEVAKSYSLPVIFISGHVAKHTAAIELLDANNARVPVTQLTKGSNEGVLKAKLEKFIYQINGARVHASIKLRDARKSETLEVTCDRIVFVTVDSDGAKSNNKVVYFTDRKPITIADVTISRMEDVGFPPGRFVQISRDCAVNRGRIESRTATAVKVTFMDRSGSIKVDLLDVGEAFRKRLA